jgi:hypothetical protein
VPNTLIVHIELPGDDDGPLERAELEWMLVKAAAEIVEGGVCRPINDSNGKRIGYWALSPQKLKVDFFNKHGSS